LRGIRGGFSEADGRVLLVTEFGRLPAIVLFRFFAYKDYFVVKIDNPTTRLSPAVASITLRLNNPTMSTDWAMATINFMQWCG
jgi:hypothetical protein